MSSWRRSVLPTLLALAAAVAAVYGDDAVGNDVVSVMDVPAELGVEQLIVTGQSYSGEVNATKWLTYILNQSTVNFTEIAIYVTVFGAGNDVRVYAGLGGSSPVDAGHYDYLAYSYEGDAVLVIRSMEIGFIRRYVSSVWTSQRCLCIMLFIYRAIPVSRQ